MKAKGNREWSVAAKKLCKSKLLSQKGLKNDLKTGEKNKSNLVTTNSNCYYFSLFLQLIISIL